LVAEGVILLGERLDRRVDGLEKEMRAGFADTRDLVRTFASRR
jgi:hypothetical protein